MKRKNLNLWQKVVKYLPKKLIYFSAIHLAAEVTIGKYSKTVIPELTLMEAIKRYEDDNKLFKYK